MVLMEFPELQISKLPNESSPDPFVTFVHYHFKKIWTIKVPVRNNIHNGNAASHCCAVETSVRCSRPIPFLYLERLTAIIHGLTSDTERAYITSTLETGMRRRNSPGKDNILRVVSVYTRSGIVKHSVLKLCCVPLEK
nr:unnamed protein product [Callosobruchus analis]